MLNHLKIFTAEQVDDVLIVIPSGEGSAFRYQDLHIESNAIRSHLLKGGCRHVIVDLHKMDYFGSEFIGALVSMLREVKGRGGRACFCAATPQMLQVLQNMSLFKLWPHLVTRDEALALVKADPKKA